MSTLPVVLNGLLVGASGYAMYCITPAENPYAFSACAFGLCHGLLGLIGNLSKEESDGCNKIREISTSIMEIVPLPLVNIELYLNSDSSSLALGHGLFIIPLAFDLIAKLFTEEGEDSPTETLKDLTILGNVVSLLFLAVDQYSYLYGGMALTAFLTIYGSMLLESLAEGTGENGVIAGNAIFYYLTAEAIAGSKE